METLSKSKYSTRDLVQVAIFAALTVIATSTRVPMPAAIGSPFVHLGNSVFLLSILLLGYKKGVLAGSFGFVIFDILNGFAPEAPYFVLECIIVGAAANLAIKTWLKPKAPYYHIIYVGIATGIAKLIMTLIKNFIAALLIGNTAKTAFLLGISAIPATIVNVITTITVVFFLYKPLKAIFIQTLLEKHK